MTAASPATARLVVLISGGGSNLQAIIDAIANGELKAQIACVVSNNQDAYGLQRARIAGIPELVIDHRDYESRNDYDKALQHAIDGYQPSLVILAGFMRILGNDFVNHFEQRLINIHPALLPDFKGLNTHQRALDAGVEQHGASVHFVTAELDAGPIILQGSLTVDPDESAAQLQRRVLEIEHDIYPKAIAKLLTGEQTA